MSLPADANDPSRELLVAYLDGELSPDDARDVEERISQDAQLREELQSLERTWNALDELPRATVDEHFTQTTIEMVTVEARREVAALTAAMPLVTRRRWATAAAVAALMVAAGFVAARIVSSTADRALAQDLPVLWGIEPLMQSADGAFLALLAEREPGLVTDYANTDVKQRADDWGQIMEKSNGERREWISDQPAETKSRLRVSQRQFEGLSAAKQTSLRERSMTLPQAVSGGQDADAIYLAALAYARWASELSSNRQLELRQITDPARRVERVGQLRQEQLQTVSRNLTDADEQAFRQAVAVAAERPEVLGLIEALQQAREQQFKAWTVEFGLTELPNWVEDWARKVDNAIETQPALRVAVLPHIAFGRDRGLGSVLPETPPELRERALEDWKQIDEVLVASLSPSAQRGLADDPVWLRAIKMRQWMLDSVTSLVDPQSMEEFFSSKSLTDNERNQLLALPPEEREERLRRLYVERVQGGIDPRTLNEVARILGNRGGGRESSGRGGPDFRGPPRDPRFEQSPGGPPRDAGRPSREFDGPPREIDGLPREIGGPPRNIDGAPRQFGGPPRDAEGPSRDAEGPAGDAEALPRAAGSPEAED